MNKRSRRIGFGLVLLAVAGGGCFAWFKGRLEPMPEAKAFFVRYPSGSPILVALRDMQKRQVIRDGRVAGWYARLRREPTFVQEGTYQVKPGWTVERIFEALRTPIRQMFRVPETNLSFRTANLLERAQVCSASDYKALVANPGEFKDFVSFDLKGKNLEGYLYPDTYDFPPLLGAKEVIKRQLTAFEKKILPLLTDSKDVLKTLTVASMVELEAGVDRDRPLIAGVIENRLAKGMPLQIDATLLYAISEWRTLTFKDYRTIDSPYSTYKHKGLPPGPICSPSLASVKAALNPAKHEFFYYVAKPDRTHLFSKTYAEHLANIAKVRRGVS